MFPNPLLPAWADLLFAAGYVFILFVEMKSSVHTYRTYPDALPGFRFHLLDALAASVAIFPTVAAIAFVARHPHGDHSRDVLIVVLIALSQIAGLIMGRIHAAVPPQNPPSEWVDAGWILFGALLAVAQLILLYLFTTVAFYVLFSMFVMTMGMGVLVLAVLVGGCVYVVREYG